MIDFDNQTAFPALVYDFEDRDGASFDVIVARATWDLRAEAGDGSTHRAVPAEEQAELVFSDVYHGELNRSSVRHESDLAPRKPRCDVIVIGSAHSPGGEPSPRVEVGVRIERPKALPEIEAVGTLLERRLVVHGPRAFVREGAGAWRLTEPEAFSVLPIRYEHAFGGELRVPAGDEAASRLDEAHRLGDELRAGHPDGPGAPIAHTACLYNPVGTGWLEGWYAELREVERWPAPRIEAPGAEISAELFARLLRGEIREGEHPALTPQGFGVITKPWQPRLARAGTFDERWLAERWPRMPADFDMAYWNGAHPAMQCAHLFGGEQVELWNLTPGPLPRVRFSLPTLSVAARIHTEDGRTGWAGACIDTLILDLERMLLSLVHRLVAPATLGITRATLMAGEEAA